MPVPVDRDLRARDDGRGKDLVVGDDDDAPGALFVSSSILCMLCDV